MRKYPFHRFIWSSFALALPTPNLFIYDRIRSDSWIGYFIAVLLLSTLPVAITASIAASKQWRISKNIAYKVVPTLFACSLLPMILFYMSIDGMTSPTNMWASIAIVGTDFIKNCILMVLLLPRASEQLVAVSRAGGFGLIFVGVIAILFMAPSYCDYTVRTYVSEGMALATAAKMASGEFYEQEKRFPVNNKEAGLPNPNEITGQAVKSIEIRPKGLIVITYNKKVKDNVELHLQVKFEDKMINWECVKHDDLQKQIDARDLPANCRVKIYPNGK